MSNNYIEWLKVHGNKLYESGGILWRLYQGAIIPASANPCFVEMSEKEARLLLRDSGAWFMRYSSRPTDKETEWWYVVCDAYKPGSVSSNTRSKINRGYRKCTVRRIDTQWLALNGYECYSAAYNRYKNANHIDRNSFRNSILNTLDGPFEYWGVFVEDHLVGYSKCIVEYDQVSTAAIKYHPEYLKYYTSYALITWMIYHYVVGKNMSISNGTRSIAHDTTFQDFLIKLGFRRQYCHLNIVCQPLLKNTIQSLYPFRSMIKRLPDRGPIHKLQRLLFQEELRRKCNAAFF